MYINDFNEKVSYSFKVFLNLLCRNSFKKFLLYQIIFHTCCTKNILFFIDKNITFLVYASFIPRTFWNQYIIILGVFYIEECLKHFWNLVIVQDNLSVIYLNMYVSYNSINIRLVDENIYYVIMMMQNIS